MGRTRSVLIIGGSGFVGTHLALRLRDSFKVYATYRSHRMTIPGVTFLPFSTENRNWVKRVVYMAQPDVIIYSAGSHDAEWSELNNHDSDAVHTSGPANVSQVADILQPKFIYLSSCYAFDGVRGNYHETDTVLPPYALGKAKIGGENFIRGRSLNYVIIRSSPVYGRGNGLHISFMDQIRMKLDRGETVELSDRELHSFAPVSGLTELIEKTIENGLRNKIIHYGGLTKATHYEFGRIFAQRFGYDPKLVVQKRFPGSRVVSNEPDYDFSLNSTLAVNLTKIKPVLLEEGLAQLEKQLIPARKSSGLASKSPGSSPDAGS